MRNENHGNKQIKQPLLQGDRSAASLRTGGRQHRPLPAGQAWASKSHEASSVTCRLMAPGRPLWARQPVLSGAFMGQRLTAGGHWGNLEPMNERLLRTTSVALTQPAHRVHPSPSCPHPVLEPTMIIYCLSETLVVPGLKLGSLALGAGMRLPKACDLKDEISTLCTHGLGFKVGLLLSKNLNPSCCVFMSLSRVLSPFKR